VKKKAYRKNRKSCTVKTKKTRTSNINSGKGASAFHSCKCESSVESAPSAVTDQTSWTFEEVVRHEISTVVAAITGEIELPIAMGADIERNRSDASLRLTFQEKFYSEKRTIAVLPFLDTEVTEFILATTSRSMLAFPISRGSAMAHVMWLQPVLSSTIILQVEHFFQPSCSASASRTLMSLSCSSLF
jgi:hypothetical protein